MDVAVRAVGSSSNCRCPSLLSSSSSSCPAPAPARAAAASFSACCSCSISSTSGNPSSSNSIRGRNAHLQLPSRVPTHSNVLHFGQISTRNTRRQSIFCSGQPLHSNSNLRIRIGDDFPVSGHCSSTRCHPVSASAEEVANVPLDEQEGDERSSSSRRTSNEAENAKKEKKNAKTFQSSWDAKDSEGEDYLYRLGKEADNLNVTVGARSGLIDSVFVGDFLGKDEGIEKEFCEGQEGADIVFDYRQKVTRSFKNLQGDFYIAPAFLEKVVTHITKNYLTSSLDTQVPLILGIWGGKGQGKSFQLELICKALNMEPVILSAGELESEWAGEPGKLIRERYRTASQVIKNQTSIKDAGTLEPTASVFGIDNTVEVKGKMSALVINDLDAGIGRFENTQCTVNNQMVVGSLMNLADNPTRVSIGQEWRAADVVNRVPIIVTGNDLSTIWAPLIRDGRMDKFYWQPTREDIVNIVHHMYSKDGLSIADIGTVVDTFPNQALDFYGALRSRTYDEEVKKWIEKIGGPEKLGSRLVSRKSSDEPLPTFVAPEATIERLLAAGESLVQEQKFVNEMRLSDVYMKKQTGGGGLSVVAT